MGNLQQLPNGNSFSGWGTDPPRHVGRFSYLSASSV
jgi:hypothetical protein